MEYNDSVNEDSNFGHVVAVRGSVIDVVFPDRLPVLNHELRAGKDEEVIVEVASQLDPRTVRGIALNSIRGLARGTPVRNRRTLARGRGTLSRDGRSRRPR